MRILVDTNVFLDVLLDREGWVQSSQQVLDWCEEHPGEAWIAWHTLSNLYYIGAKSVGSSSSMKQIDEILQIFEVAPCDSKAARFVRTLVLADFEDALQVAAATSANADRIVTRNTGDFIHSPVPAVDPVKFLKS